MNAKPYLIAVLVLAAALAMAGYSSGQETGETGPPGPSLKALAGGGTLSGGGPEVPPAAVSGLPTVQDPGGDNYLNGTPAEEVIVRLAGTDAPPEVTAEATMFPVPPPLSGQ